MQLLSKIKNMFINLIKKIRSKTVLFFKPKEDYFLFKNNFHNLKPISSKFGFDRGMPVDRYYIESFLEDNKEYIKGKCLEIHDNYYLKKFGEGKITECDVLDMYKDNKEANIYGNLKKLDNVASNTYDCLIITHTFGSIDDYQSAIGECWRILKKGGVLLATCAAMGPIWESDKNYWRFTVASFKYSFGKYFKDENIYAKSFGNVLAGQCFWVGLAKEELTSKEIEYNDPHFPIIITVRARK